MGQITDGPQQMLMDTSDDVDGPHHHVRGSTPKRRLEDRRSGYVTERELIARLEAELQEKDAKLNRYELAASDNELG